jgi:hypothetical protein
MGTNFYIKDQDGMGLHIGKSSAGWCFSLHVYPEHGINSLDEWKSLFCDPYALIQDEYGRFVTPAEMLDWITNRSWDGAAQHPQIIYDQNHAERGPNGLMRSKVDGVHCVGHGEGTWDYIVGEFS